MIFLNKKIFSFYIYQRLFTKVCSPFVHFKPVENPVLVMTLYIKNEGDIIEANLNFHKAMGIDWFIVTDNGSDDSTMDILNKYKAKGWIKEIIVNTSKEHPQVACVDRMIRLARKKYSADWVINCDADEFWWTPSENLKKEVASLNCNMSFVPLFNVLPERDLPFYEWNKVVVHPIEDFSVYDLSPHSVYARQISKVMHRTKYYEMISKGNHTVQMTLEKGKKSSSMIIFHYPFRGYTHFENKVVRGGKAYEKNSNKQQGKHLRYWYSWYQLGLLHEEYDRVIGMKYYDEFLIKGIVGTNEKYLNFLQKSLNICS